MRAIFLLALGILALPATAFAFPESAGFLSDVPVSFPDPREDIYCQLPSGGWGVYNASTAFSSEMADDMPANLSGIYVGGVAVWVGEWGGVDWMPFTSLIVNIYDDTCPPPQDPVFSVAVPYDELNAIQVYAGNWYVYQCQADVLAPITIDDATSIGFVVDQDWGQNPPYCGMVITDGVLYGCELYWDAEFWGYSRWIPGSQYFGIAVDLAWCLVHGIGPTSTVETHWGSIRGLFR